MNSKEKILFAVVALLVASGVGYAVINSLLLSPAADARASIEKNRDDLERFEAINGREVVLNKELEQLLTHTYTGRFDSDPSETQRLSGSRLRALALAAGLRENTLDLRASSGRTSPGEGGFLEVGWTLRADGSLKSVVDFLYMVRKQEYLQRIENLTLTPDLAESTVQVGFKYFTLVMVPQTRAQRDLAEKPYDESTIPSMPVADVTDEARRRLDGIASRYLFRPYVKKKVVPPPPPPPVEPTRTDPPPPPPPPPTDRYFAVVGLPTFSADPAGASILVRDERDGSVKEYLVGDELADGTIAAVDYRVMASHADPTVAGYSRVIVRRDDGYYAFDLGAKLSEGWKMSDEQLPESLRQDPAEGPPADETPAADDREPDRADPPTRPMTEAEADDAGIPEELRFEITETNGDSGG